MTRVCTLFVGGLVAMGLDPTERYLLAVSHSGRGVFSVGDWARVARDTAVRYPDNARAEGIGPLEGQSISVIERTDERSVLWLQTKDGKFCLSGESDGITVSTRDEYG